MTAKSHVPVPKGVPAGERTGRWAGHAMCLTALLGLCGWIFRIHLRGAAVYLGNFDRLNSHLNVLSSWVHAIRTGASPGWDDVMFMGSSLYGLPYTFPNPLTYLVALADPGQLAIVAGYAAIALLVLAAWAAYAFIYDVCRQRLPSLIGAALYQCSTLAILKVSQNDMSFAVLIHIPIVLLAARHVDESRHGRFWVGLLACALTSLLYFTFLQKAAYAVLLLAAYAVYRSWRLFSWKPVAALALALTVAVVVSAPRLMTVAEDFGQLTRSEDAGGKRDFAALYRFQHITPREFFRWFDDGIFGRIPEEARALGNNINLSEGLLLYTAQVTPFLIGLVALRSRGRWLPLLRPTPDLWKTDVPFFGWTVLAVFAIVLVQPVAHLFFLAFLQVDFTHARVVVAALLPMCTLVAWWLAGTQGMPHKVHRPIHTVGLLAVAAISGGALAWGVERLGQRADGVRFELTDRVDYLVAGAILAVAGGNGEPAPPAPRAFSSARVEPRAIALGWTDGPGETEYRIEMRTHTGGGFTEVGVAAEGTTQYRVADVALQDGYSFRMRACGRASCSPYASSTPVAAGAIAAAANSDNDDTPRESTWLHGGRVARVIWSGVTLVLLLTALWFARRRTATRWVIAYGIAFMAVAQAIASAEFHVSGAHLDTNRPFETGGFMRGAPSEFRVPSFRAQEALRGRLENDAYRSVLICSPRSVPLSVFCAPHISYFWRLRVVEGYSSGVPTRLVSLPWPREEVSLRAISFTTAERLPWPLLTLLNVKYAVSVDGDLYRNRYVPEPTDPTDFDGKLEILEAPLPVTPRAFFAASVAPVPNLATAVRTLFPPTETLTPTDVTVSSVVENFSASGTYSTTGTITASYDHGSVRVVVTPANEPRFLVLNELFHPRWRACSSQGELPVYPTNVVMRGVMVPPGVDSVHFEFVPAYRMATSIPAAALGLGLLGVGLRRSVWTTSSPSQPLTMETTR